MSENNENGDELWNRYVKNEKIEPLNDKKMVLSHEKAATNPQPLKENKTQTYIPTIRPQITKTYAMDSKLEAKLRKGKIKIDATIDLHGFSQNQAYRALSTFIYTNHAKNNRTLLIITGKGQDDKDRDHWMDPIRGILKQRVPQWLSTPPYSSMILNVMEAHQKHGGQGALYVYLRKKK